MLQCSRVFAHSPSDKRNLEPKTRVFIDYLADHFGAVPPWEGNGHEGDCRPGVLAITP